MANNQRNKNSFVQGFVPCGNPKRVSSGDAIQMAHGRKRARPTGDEDDLRTEVEKHVQTLAKKQTSTDISVASQFSQHRDFTSATSHDPTIDQLTGLLKYEDYRQVENLDSRVEELRHCGLTDEEIVIKMKHDLKEKLDLTDITKGLGTNPDIETERLREIEKKIKDRELSLQKAESFKGALELSRQSRDLEKSIAQRYGKESSLPKTLVTEKKFTDSHPDDPINNIPDILRDIKGKVVRESRRDRRRRRKMERRKEYYSQFESTEEEKLQDVVTSDSDSEACDQFIGPLPKESNVVGDTLQPVCCDSREDCCTSNVSQNRLSETQNRDLSVISKTVNTKTCNQQFEKPCNEEAGTSQVLRNERIPRHIESSVLFVSEEEMRRNRLTEEEMKQMEKFKNYEKGVPNKILYVKNLPNRTTEEDLISLFGKFQSDEPSAPSVVFKLLTGRMKGQAFITFPDEILASKALDSVNGYKLRERPLVISFGKKQT